VASFICSTCQVVRTRAAVGERPGSARSRTGVGAVPGHHRPRYGQVELDQPGTQGTGGKAGPLTAATVTLANGKLRSRSLLESATRLDPQAVVDVTHCRWKTADQPPRGVITEWSRKSRAAMCRTFAELDYTPLVESGRAPAMVTLTDPGEWVSVAPDGASVKRHMVLWRKRFHRQCGELARFIWKLEFQPGRTPCALVDGSPTDTRPVGPVVPGRLSKTWADIVAHPDPTEHARHRLAGTAVDVLNGLRACDPKQLAIYFTRHSSPNTLGDKEYQHIVPEPLREPGKGPGRFWGVHGLKRATVTVEIEKDAYLKARRIIRRWSRSQSVYAAAASRLPSVVVPRICSAQSGPR
jgi:hypothetical protein